MAFIYCLKVTMEKQETRLSNDNEAASKIPNKCQKSECVILIQSFLVGYGDKIRPKRLQEVAN